MSAAADEVHGLEQCRVRRDAAQAVLLDTTAEIKRRVREAHALGVPKVDIARAAGVSRPTVDKWLEEK